MSLSLFFRDGRPFSGQPRQDDGGPLYTVVETRCSRCGGAGGSDKWAHTGWKCYDCGGTGRGPNRIEKLYSAEKLAKLNAAQQKRESKRAVEQAEAAEKANAERAAATARFETENAGLLARVAETLADRDEFVNELLAKGRRFGSLSAAQIAAIEKSVAREEAKRAARGASQYVGSFGERLSVPVTVAKVSSYERSPFRSYGNYTETVWIMTLVDADGNHYVTKSARFGPSDIPTEKTDERGAKYAVVGETFTVRGTVAEHSEFDGIKQTVLSRPAVVG